MGGAFANFPLTLCLTLKPLIKTLRVRLKSLSRPDYIRENPPYLVDDVSDCPKYRQKLWISAGWRMAANVLPWAQAVN